MQRSLSSLVSQLLGRETTKGGQPVLLPTHSRSSSTNKDWRRNRCRLCLTSSPVSPDSADRGSISSVGSSKLPQLSHWSPLADAKPQYGRVPRIYRSDRKR